MSELLPFSEREFPRFPILTETEVETLSRAIHDSPDLIRRVEMDPSGAQAREKLIDDAISRDTEELYATRTPIDELHQMVSEAYAVGPQNPNELDDPDF